MKNEIKDFEVDDIVRLNGEGLEYYSDWGGRFYNYVIIGTEWDQMFEQKIAIVKKLGFSNYASGKFNVNHLVLVEREMKIKPESKIKEEFPIGTRVIYEGRPYKVVKRDKINPDLCQLFSLDRLEPCNYWRHINHLTILETSTEKLSESVTLVLNITNDSSDSTSIGIRYSGNDYNHQQPQIINRKRKQIIIIT